MQKYASHVMAMSMVMPVIMVVPVTMSVCVIIFIFMRMDVVVSSEIVGRFMVTMIMRVLDE